MKNFWQGFNNHNSGALQFKKHGIMVFLDFDNDIKEKALVSRLASKFPTTRVKIINVKKDTETPIKHKVTSTPVILLLKNGREVERLNVKEISPFLTENLFRKAHV